MNDGTVPEYYCFTWHIDLENIEYSHLPVHLIIYTHFITSISKKRYNFFPWILWCREMYLMRGGGLFQFCLISYMSRGSSLGVCADALGWGMGISPHPGQSGAIHLWPIRANAAHTGRFLWWLMVWIWIEWVSWLSAFHWDSQIIIIVHVWMDPKLLRK